MMLWIEMHGGGASKGGTTNFDVSSYGQDLPWLANITQVRARQSKQQLQQQQRQQQRQQQGGTIMRPTQAVAGALKAGG